MLKVEENMYIYFNKIVGFLIVYTIIGIGIAFIASMVETFKKPPF